MKLGILAGSYQEASSYAQRNVIPPADWFYISTVATLLGSEAIRYIRIGTWESRTDLDPINIQLQIRGLEPILNIPAA